MKDVRMPRRRDMVDVLVDRLRRDHEPDDSGRRCSWCGAPALPPGPACEEHLDLDDLLANCYLDSRHV